MMTQAGDKPENKNVEKRRIVVFWVLLGIGLLIFWMFPRCPGPHELPPRIICGSNISGLVKAMIVYANYDESERFPSPDKWCDLLVESDYVSRKQFLCKEAVDNGDQGPCHYAINPNATPASEPDMVALFETKGGWNQSGGPELLTVENHEGKGCNVAFVSTSVRFVKAGDLSKLKWKPNPNEK
ncbi:MAG: hypothetical protein ACYSTZ_11185 [Planctomycetota bacterium]|jgi:hypothetical protein